MNSNDPFWYPACELAKAAPRAGEMEKVNRLKMHGPDGESRTLLLTPAEYFRVVEALTTEPPITYRVQPHDITTLTWPMWDACGIECPKMIGAPCSDGMRCPGWSAKFPHAAAEVVYGWSLHWQPETCGDVDQPIGCNAIFRTPEDERHDDNPMAAGVILSTDSQGSVFLARYESAEVLESSWSELQKLEAEYDRANCEDCTEGEPCANHEED